MARIQEGSEGRAVRTWQGALYSLGYHTGARDGIFGPVTAGATRDFQETHFLAPTGLLDPPTVLAMARAKAGRTVRSLLSGQSRREFRLGPDLSDDLRSHRPYFLLPIDPEDGALRQERIGNLRLWAKAQAGDPDPKSNARPRPFTDIFVMSHGWHRNLFGAVCAYDQTAARIAVLLKSGRLPHPENFHPLFLNLHWHSDPGENSWVDNGGRRDKGSFLRNVEERFDCTNPPEGASGQRRNPRVDFETMFEVMSQMSAPGKDALDPDLASGMVPDLTKVLYLYSLRQAPDAPDADADKVAVLWQCYDTATPRGVLLDQDEHGRRFLWIGQALVTLFKFALTLGGAMLFISQWKTLGIDRLLHDLVEDVFYDSTGLALYTLLMLSIFGVVVPAVIRRFEDWPEAKRGIGGLGFLAWAYWQFWFTVPLVAYIVFMYFVTSLVTVFNWIPADWWVFNERAGKRGRAPDRRFRWSFPFRWTLEWLARLPVSVVNLARARDARYDGILDAVNNQLAFYEMQYRGVDRGDDAGMVLADLVSALAFEDGALAPDARVHLMGHSFGSLVVANALRRLAWADNFTLAQPEGGAGPSERRKVYSITLLQGAIARDWFEGEDRVVNTISTGLSCVYSRYDTANGFYYPAANKARLAAGYLGLQSDKIAFRREGGYASLVRPPKIPNYPPPPGGAPVPINFDASRLIYYGPVATGGGHDDIFKDDVVHAMWALCGLP